ncbi:MAG: hypothetical protein QG652_565 [Pseudomonadota bacterium]|nr:hypothetical protein [Pseudomonadota bacterium]
MPENDQNEMVCLIPRSVDYSGVEIVELQPQSPLNDYLQAMKFANAVADEKLTDYMLLSWYDRDRDYESPQHSSECHQGSAVPGYVDYGLNHGARLKVDIEHGRFVFFYLPLNG